MNLWLSGKNREELRRLQELAKQEWSEGLEHYLALGCFFWLIVVSIAGLATIGWGIMLVLEHL